MGYRSETVTVPVGGSATLDGFSGDSLVSVLVAPAAGAAGSVTIRLTRDGVTATLKVLTCAAGVCELGEWSPALALDDDDVLIIQTGTVGAASVLVGLYQTAASTFADVAEHVAIHAPGAPDNLLLNAVRETWRDFLRRSKAWRKQYFIELADDTTEYDLADDGDAGPEQIREVRIMTETEKDDDDDGALVDPNSYRMEGAAGARTIKLLTAAPGSETDDVWLRVECVMALPASALVPGNNDLFAEWRDAVVYGAAWLLCSMPKRRWSNRAEAKRMSGLYMRQVGMAYARTANEGRAGGGCVGV